MMNRGFLTGEDYQEEEKLIIYPFDDIYNAEVKLTLDGKFLGITAISIDKSFLSLGQKLKSIGYIDTFDEYPPD